MLKNAARFFKLQATALIVNPGHLVPVVNALYRNVGGVGYVSNAELEEKLSTHGQLTSLGDKLLRINFWNNHGFDGVKKEPTFSWHHRLGYGVELGVYDAIHATSSTPGRLIGEDVVELTQNPGSKALLLKLDIEQAMSAYLGLPVKVTQPHYLRLEFECQSDQLSDLITKLRAARIAVRPGTFSCNRIELLDNDLQYIANQLRNVANPALNAPRTRVL